MNKNQVAKRAYLAPCIEVCPVRIDNPLLAGSPVSGGHNEAGDDEELNAKHQNFSDGEENLWQANKNLWVED